MKTPILDFLKSYAESAPARLHMPGHKGRGPLGCEALDITEVPGADVLSSADGIIKESEETTSALFGTERTVYSTEGSSLAIRTMLALVKKYAGKRTKILAARSFHKTFLTAAALLDIDVCFLACDGILSCAIDEESFRGRIVAEKPDAVYITSPDYLGNCADVEKLARICHEEKTLLIVDNAHGAYLKFLPESRHPIDLGADMCCDSAHKTLPVLTGGAYLHISKSAPKLFADEAKAAMSLFASTSPSYLILASLDAANARIEKSLRDEIKCVWEKKKRLCEVLITHGYTVVGDEPLKITVAPKSFGYTGDELARRLLKDGIVCEHHDSDFTVMMLSADTTDEDFKKVEAALLSYEKRDAISARPPRALPPEVVMPLRDVLFAPTETVALSACEGRIFADVSVSCPPAIPVVICGERIGKGQRELLAYYGTKACKVVKK